MSLGVLIVSLKRAVASILGLLGAVGESGGVALEPALHRAPVPHRIRGDASVPPLEASGSRALFSETLSMPTAGDAGEARAVAEFLGARIERGTRLDWGPGRTKSWITVYAVDAADEQNRILELLRAERKCRGWKPICVRFDCPHTEQVGATDLRCV